VLPCLIVIPALTVARPRCRRERDFIRAPWIIMPPPEKHGGVEQPNELLYMEDRRRWSVVSLCLAREYLDILQRTGE